MSIKIPPTLLPYQRQAWKPVGEYKDSSPLSSKFSGVPYLHQNEEYPRCQNCQEYSQLFVQLNLDQLPESLNGEFGDGILQLFYCTNDEPLCELDCASFFPFAKSVLVRIIQPDDSVPTILAPDNSFPQKAIIAWQALTDYPNQGEGEILGIGLEDTEWEELFTEFPLAGDKLAGYPNWIQGIEYPGCPLCGELMRLVFQIDSEDNVPHLFGDVGIGHITQCRNHKRQLAFAWACS